MRTENMRRSENVEDRRGRGPGRAVGGGIGVVGVVIVVLYLLMGGNPQALVQPGGLGVPGGSVVGGGGGGGIGGGHGLPGGAGGAGTTDPRVDFVSRVLGDTEDVWTELFRRDGMNYQKPRLVVFEQSVESACGLADAATGPFYCPADQQVYIDLSFYDELSGRLGAPGDFAQAYVIAHEVGHHIQRLMGVTDKVHRMKERVSEAEYNDLSVRLELQADFFAGVWAHHGQKARKILDAGDIEEGLRAAAAIGDDRLQMRSRGYVVPDSFTHGTSEQRVRWFRKGLESGDLSQCDTFKVEKP